MVPSGFWTPSATSQIRINGAQSLQPYGLRPAPSLSTLNPRRCRREPKTRYGMCWVDTFPVALAATSNGALRGAPKTYGSAVHTTFQILAGSQIYQEIWALLGGSTPRGDGHARQLSRKEWFKGRPQSSRFFEKTRPLLS